MSKQTTTMIIEADSTADLMVKQNVIEAVNKLSSTQLKNLSKLTKSTKALETLESNVKFAVLFKFL